MLDLFLAMSTQWRIGMAGPTGLDYAALPMAARMAGVRLQRELLADLRLMEGGALAAMAEKQKR